MQNIQEIFAKMQEMKKEQKEIKEMYKDALAQTDDYNDIQEELKTLREKRKQIETRVQGEMGKAWEKAEDLKLEMDSYKEMIADIAMNTLMNGGTIEVKDEYDNPYEPVFKVNFKKLQDGQTSEE